MARSISRFSPVSPVSKRAFVILVVMMMLAIATAVAMSQFNVVATESVTSVRAKEEIQARAMAEGCLTLLQRYAEGYIGTSPPGFNEVDFDGLLDRDGTLNNADDYLPSVGTRVLVPRNLTPTTGATAAAHQWAFLSRGAGANTGGCLLRVEDNSDDGFGLSSVPTGSTQSVAELAALGRDVPQRDRDRSVYLTAIGLFPVLPGTTPDFAHERAHARVTLRRLFATSNPVQTPPAVQACDDVVINSSSDICGLGGVQADTITVNGGSTCGCGAYVANTVTPSSPPPACTGCTSGSCAAPSVTQAPPPACTPPPIPNATYYMDNRGFADPGSSTNNIGATNSCKVYIDRWGRSFIWDTTDPYANDPAGPLGVVALPLPANRPPPLPIHDCRNYTGAVDGTGRVVELPCEWDTTTLDGDPESVTCDFTNSNPKLRQTPCWKPIANLGDVQRMTTDVWIGTPPLTYSSIVAGHVEMSSNQNSEDLMFVRNRQIPNVRNAAMMFATGDPLTTMCGNANGCADCDITSTSDNNDWWTECSNNNPTTPGVTATGTTCGDFHSHTHQNTDHLPWPVVFAWDVDPAFEINFEYEAAATKPLNATILTNGKIAFGNAVSFCCAECGDGNNCRAPTTSPGIALDFIPAAACVPGGSQIPAPTFAVPPPPPGPVQFVPSGYGYAFKADGECDINGDSTVIGDVECRAISIPDDPCLVGNVLVTGSSTSVGCAGAPCSPSAHVTAPNVGVCLAGSARILGDIYSQGSVCATSNVNLTGDLFTMGNAAFNSNFRTSGQVFANQDVTFDSNATVDFAGTGQILSVGSQGLTTFMETSW